MARLELEKKRRQVLGTVDCRQWWATVYKVVRRARLSRKTAKQVVAVGDMVKVVSMLDAAVRAKLYDLVDRARKETRKFGTAETHEREDPPNPADYRQCLERKEYFMAKLKEVEAGLKRGQYLYEHEVNRAMTDALSAFKDRLLAIPQRVAAQVSATEDPAEIDKVLADAFKEAVDGLPEDITEGLTVVEIEEDGTDNPQ